MDGPPRPDAAEIAAVLAATAQPQSHVLLDAPVDPVDGPLAFTTASLWHIQLWCAAAAAQLQWTMAAQAPDGRQWIHGCQRYWATTGEVVEPLDALTPLEREALRQRLLTAVSWPMPEQSPGQVVMTLQPPVEEPKPVRRRGRGGKR